MDKVIDILIGQGILGVFLVIVIWYFIKEMKSLKKEMKNKSIAHAEQMAVKDKKIEALNEKIHTLGINAVTAVKDFTNAIKGI